MDILHKRTTNNESGLIEHLGDGELGLVLSQNTEDTKIILKNNDGGVEEIYTKSHPIDCGEWNPIVGYNVGDVLYYNNTTQKYTVSSSVTTEYGKPIGIVVVPTSHNLYGDNSCAVMSLNFMRYDNPTVGGADQYILWGGLNDISSLTNYNSVLYDNNSKGDGGFLASSKFTANSLYEGQQYGYFNYSISSNRIMPIYNEDGSKNIKFQGGSDANALKDVNGSGNTQTLIGLATAQQDWRTADTITNSYDDSYYPAACCCWRYNPNGVTEGKWYLPSACELAYVMSKYSEINAKLTVLNGVGGVTTYPLGENPYWTSTEFGSTYSRSLDFDSGNLNNYIKSNDTSVRSFLRFAGGSPL